VDLTVTWRCNSRCRYCDIWKHKKGLELSTKQFKKVIKSLKDWLGTFSSTFTGGEPLLRNDIAEIISFCSSNGIYTNIISNGLNWNLEKVKQLSDAGLYRVTFSIDSHQ
jgi:PqqA peptide cyclase